MIRKYNEEDLTDILSFWKSSASLFHPEFKADFFNEQEAEIRDGKLGEIDSWVYEENNRVEGFISLHGHRLLMLFVNPTSQGKGIGRLLIQHAKTLSFSYLELFVFENNKQGIAIYEKMGFKKIGRVKSPFPDIFGVIMRLDY
jgi:putative acetyltransferase